MLFGTAEFMSLGFQELPDGSAKAEKLANPKGMYVKQITQTILFLCVLIYDYRLLHIYFSISVNLIDVNE